MKQYNISILIVTIILALSSCDKATEPNEEPVYIDKIEAARTYYETVDSIDYWYTEIKDTFKLSETPFPRIIIGKILDSDSDTIVAGIVPYQSFDTVYFARTFGSVNRDTMNIIKMPNFRYKNFGKFTIFGYYIHNGTKTVLPDKVFYVVR